MIVLVWDRKIALGSADLQRVHMTEEYKTRLHDWIQARLRAGQMTITFVKKDGQERVMQCTLDQRFIPNYLLPTSNKKKGVDTLVVYDLDNAAWRSFTIDRLLKIEVETFRMKGDFVWELAKDL